jgi:ankyrin repeat protein
MRYSKLFGFTVLWLVLCVTGVFAISWEEIQVKDPISGHSVTVQQVRSYGGYVYGFPSKYDGVYWPYIDQKWIWFCPESGYTSFGNDFKNLFEEEVQRIKNYLATNYNKNQPPTLEQKLQLLEKIYELRNKNYVFWAWFYRVLAAWYDGRALGNVEQDSQLALNYREKALPLIAIQVKYLPPGFNKIQHLYILGEYNRQLGNTVEAKIYFARARNLQWIDENGGTQTGHQYIDQILDDQEKLLYSEQSNYDQQKLILVAGLGDVRKMKNLLDSGTDINATSATGRTALQWAAWAGHADVVLLLLESGSSINIASGDGSTALILAANEGSSDIVQILIDRNADVDAQDKEGMSALMLATLQNHEEIVRKLIRAGADINRQSNSGDTALGFALVLKYTRIVELINQAAAQLQKDSAMLKEHLYDKITRDLTLLPGPHPEVLPEGRSVFYGEYTCAQGLAGSVTIMHRSGGDLTIVNLNGSPISVKNIQPVGHFRAVGTYNPKSNLYTEVPDTWLSPSTPGWIMAGRNGVYDSNTGRLSGTVPIGATWTDGSPLCTTFKHSRIARSQSTDILEREPFKPPMTLTGSPIALLNGTSQWSGTFTFHGIRFALTLELHHTEGGRLAGTFYFRKSGQDGTEASFLMAGTHNPDTGRFSLGPKGWVTNTQTGRQMFFVDGHHLRDPNRLSIRIIAGSGNSSDEEIVVLNPLE